MTQANPKRGTTVAEEAKTEAKKTRKKPQGPRQVKPFHLLISARDEAGNTIPLSQDRVTIEVVKDPAQLLQRLTTGGMDGAVYHQFTPPVERKSPAENA